MRKKSVILKSIVESTALEDRASAILSKFCGLQFYKNHGLIDVHLNSIRPGISNLCRSQGFNLQKVPRDSTVKPTWPKPHTFLFIHGNASKIYIKHLVGFKNKLTKTLLGSHFKNTPTQQGCAIVNLNSPHFLNQEKQCHIHLSLFPTDGVI